MKSRLAQRLVFLALAASPGVAEAAITKGPWVQHVTTTSAVVRVEVSPPSAVSLEIDGRASVDGAATRTIASSTASLHSIPIDALTPGTRYTYTVRASGESRPAAFTTAPDGAPNFKFIIYGDTRTDDAAHAAIVRAIVPVGGDFLVNTGDFVDRGEDEKSWQSFFEIEAPILRERCIFACVGNHEITDGQGMNFIRYFGPSGLAPPAPDGSLFAKTTIAPEQLQGTFRWGNVRFFLINGMVKYQSGPDRSWIDKALSDADNEAGLAWRVVVTHHATWSSGPHGDNLLFAQAHLADAFRAHKVDLVVGGHDHIYERGAFDGMPYLISGGGGAPLYKIKNPKPFARKLESVHHFIAVSVTDAAMQISATRVDGTTIERCDLRKGAGWDCDGTNKPEALTSAMPSSSSLIATSSASSSGSSSPASPSKCACRAAGSAGSSGLGMVGAGILGITLVARRRLRVRSIARWLGARSRSRSSSSSR